MCPELMNQPITGICSFGRYPSVRIWSSCTPISACWASPTMQAPASTPAPGWAPGASREASTQYGRGETGYYDYETDEQMLCAPITIADCGDVDVLSADRTYTFERAEEAVRRIVRRRHPHGHGG